MSEALYTSLYHGKETCSSCGLIAGRQNLKTCASCHLVRYCSRACQKRAWPQHKKRCHAVHNDVAGNPEDSALYADFTHWKNTWSGALRFISLWAMDLVNAPQDRLATHCVMIQMMHGQLISRENFLKLCDKNDAPKAMVDIFQNDQRGNDTLQIILICEGFFRVRKPDASRLGADYWDDGLKDAMEAGDPSSIQNCLLDAIGRHNTLIRDAPLPPFHPPS